MEESRQWVMVDKLPKRRTSYRSGKEYAWLVYLIYFQITHPGETITIAISKDRNIDDLKKKIKDIDLSFNFDLVSFKKLGY